MLARLSFTLKRHLKISIEGYAQSTNAWANSVGFEFTRPD